MTSGVFRWITSSTRGSHSGLPKDGLGNLSRPPQVPQGLAEFPYRPRQRVRVLEDGPELRRQPLLVLGRPLDEGGATDLGEDLLDRPEPVVDERRAAPKVRERPAPTGVGPGALDGDPGPQEDDEVHRVPPQGAEVEHVVRLE